MIQSPNVESRWRNPEVNPSCCFNLQPLLGSFLPHSSVFSWLNSSYSYTSVVGVLTQTSVPRVQLTIFLIHNHITQGESQHLLMCVFPLPPDPLSQSQKPTVPGASCLTHVLNSVRDLSSILCCLVRMCFSFIYIAFCYKSHSVSEDLSLNKMLLRTNQRCWINSSAVCLPKICIGHILRALRGDDYLRRPWFPKAKWNILHVSPYTPLLRLSVELKPTRDIAGSWDVHIFSENLKSGQNALQNGSLSVDHHYQGRKASSFSNSWEHQAYSAFIEFAILMHKKMSLVVAFICNSLIINQLFVNRASSFYHCLLIHFAHYFL